MPVPKDPKELWLGYAKDAVSRVTITVEDLANDELASDLAAFVSDFADEMLEQYETGWNGGAKKKKRKKKATEEDDDEEDEDEDD